MLRHVETQYNEHAQETLGGTYSVTERATSRTNQIAWIGPGREGEQTMRANASQGRSNTHKRSADKDKRNGVRQSGPHTTTPAPETGKSPHGGGDINATGAAV